MFHTSFVLGARSMSPIATPLVIPQLLWVLGLIMFLAIALLLLVRATGALLTGDFGSVGRLIGSRTLSEEVAAEIGETGSAHERHAGPKA